MLRVAALAVLLLLVVASVLTLQTMRRLPDTLVYFVADSGSYLTLEPVGRQSNAGGPEERAKAALTELSRGPTAGEREKGLSSTVPSEVRTRRVDFGNGVLTVDLSDDFERGGGSAEMQGRLYQVFYTLTQPRDVEAVSLLIEGRPVRVFGGEGILVDSPWFRAEHERLPVW